MDMSLEEFILKYKGYPKHLANYYCNQLSEYNFDFDDLCQVGYLGMIEGYYNYDSSKSSPSTYAYLQAKYGILKYIQKNRYITYVPIEVDSIFLKLIKKNTEFYKLTGNNMSIFEMLEYIKAECNTKKYKINLEFIKRLLEIEKSHLRNKVYQLDEKVDNNEYINFEYYFEKKI